MKKERKRRPGGGRKPGIEEKKSVGFYISERQKMLIQDLLKKDREAMSCIGRK